MLVCCLHLFRLLHTKQPASLQPTAGEGWGAGALRLHLIRHTLVLSSSHG
jgi:hypothetical protein